MGGEGSVPLILLCAPPSPLRLWGMPRSPPAMRPLRRGVGKGLYLQWGGGRSHWHCEGGQRGVARSPARGGSSSRAGGVVRGGAAGRGFEDDVVVMGPPGSAGKGLSWGWGQTPGVGTDPWGVRRRFWGGGASHRILLAAKWLMRRRPMQPATAPKTMATISPAGDAPEGSGGHREGGRTPPSPFRPPQSHPDPPGLYLSNTLGVLQERSRGSICNQDSRSHFGDVGGPFPPPQANSHPWGGTTAPGAG